MIPANCWSAERRLARTKGTVHCGGWRWEVSRAKRRACLDRPCGREAGALHPGRRGRRGRKGHPALLGALGNAETTLADVDARLGLLELMYRTQVNGNPFTVSFSDMSGLVVTGVWNETLKRVEF